MAEPLNSQQSLLFPALLLKNYLHFLSRRPISGSNLHFKAGRIASLQTLAPLLAVSANDEMAHCVEMLRALTTTNLARFAPQILRGLQRYREPQLPRHLVASLAAPPAEFFEGVRRALLVLGQGIGIGDEILTFPFATALRGRLGDDAKLTVLSSYRDLWRDVEGVDEQAIYDGLSEIVHAVREGGYDLVAMVDFERPGLLSTFCAEPGVIRYIELAMGLRELSALDKASARVWKLEHPDPYYSNFYHHMERMKFWLGDVQDARKAEPRRLASPGSQPGREVVVYASPFTSKEDPSQRFWMELLLSMLPEELPPGVTICIQVDSGANYSTRAFAVELARSIQNAGRKGVTSEPASTIGLAGSLLSLADAMQRIAKTDIVVTSDSFPAHAGQLYGKLTLVLARDGVENWRAPAPGNFYLRVGTPLEELVLQARMLLGDLARLGPTDQCIVSSASLIALRASAESLEAALRIRLHETVTSTLRSLWSAAREATLIALAESSSWPPGYEVLTSDNDYSTLLPEMVAADMTSSEMQLHLRCRMAEWRNSNLLKYACWPGRAGGEV